MLLVLLLALCDLSQAIPGAPGATVARFSFGELDLPPGWRKIDDRGIDSYVGHFSDEKERVRLRFDIGSMAGVYAAPSRKSEFAWFKTEVVRGETMTYGVRRGQLVVSFTFEHHGPANFYIAVGKPAEIEPLLAILRTLRPSARD